MEANELVYKLPAAFRVAAAAGKTYVIQLNLSTRAHVVIADGQCRIEPGQAERSDLALSLSDDNFVALMQGRLGHIEAFVSGRLQVVGDLMLAQRLANFFDAHALRG